MKNKLYYASVLLLLLEIPAFAGTMGMDSPTQNTASTSSSQLVRQGCSREGFTFQNGQLILGTQNGFSSGLFLIHNNSDFQQLLLSHPTNTAMSAGWESRLDRGQWSAINITRPNFVINCFGRRPGAIGYVDCASVLEICSYGNPNAGGGGYWPSENKSLSETMGTLRSRNIVTVPKSLSNQ